MKKEDFMRKAIELSIENVKNGGGPFGAVIVKDGEIVATGVNRVTANHDPTAHAEVSAIRAACQNIYWAHLDKIYYGNNKTDAARIGFDDSFIYDELALERKDRKKVMEELLPDEAIAAFRAWEEKADKVEY